jgi:hypothetical protein
MNVASNARHSDAGSWTKELFLIDGWAVVTLAMTISLFGGIEHDISAIAVTAITCIGPSVWFSYWRGSVGILRQ